VSRIGLGSPPVTARRWLAMLAGLAIALAACGNETSPTAAPSTSAVSTAAAVSPGAPTGTAAASVPATPAPTTPPDTSEPQPGATTGPSGSLEPSVDTLKVKRTADCLADNGSGTVGSIKLTWTSSGTTGVRISIDPPSVEGAYDYGYGDYPASGSAVVPFACDPPNHDANGDYHLYVVTTIHTKGRYAWRYVRVYATSPAP
jgi:hypothetical protein